LPITGASPKEQLKPAPFKKVFIRDFSMRHLVLRATCRCACLFQAYPMSMHEFNPLHGIHAGTCPSFSTAISSVLMSTMVEPPMRLPLMPHGAQLALYEPDIPQNTGTLLRLAACLDFPVHLIEPAGFDASDRNLKRAGLDYLPHVMLHRHLSFAHFEAWRKEQGHRLLLATTHGAVAYTDFVFLSGDLVLLGRESAGVPAPVHAAADHRLVIPLKPGLRSINIALAGAMLMGEALRQLNAFPEQ
jgi:tRNA (cytidine/uridine-2'-O-)-methyltransferase